MDHILFSRQTRSDTTPAGLGIIITFGLAVGAAVIAVREQSALAFFGSALLFFVGLRGMGIYFQRRAFSFVVSTDTITFGFVHEPKRQTRIETNNIIRAHWKSRSLELESGKMIRLPLRTIDVTQDELRAVFDRHFPQIESVD